MFTWLRTDAAHHSVCSLDAFPKQLHVGQEAHQTFHTKVVALEYSGFGLFFMSTVFPSIRTMIHFRSAHNMS